MSPQTSRHRPAASEPAPLPGTPVVRQETGAAPIDSRGLLQGRKVLTIQHRGEVYRLQETRQGKLILTK